MEYILIIIICAAVVYAVIKGKKQRREKSRKKMLSDELARLKQMNVDLDVEGYIKEEKKAMTYPENHEIMHTMQMNLVAAYINNAQYEEAVKCLKQFDLSKLPEDFVVLYHHNLLFAYWMMDSMKFGKQLDESWSVLEKYCDEEQWKPILKIIQVLIDLYKEEVDEAEKHIRQLSAPNSDHAASLRDMLWCELYISTNRIGKAKNCIEKISGRNNFPIMHEWMKRKNDDLKNKGLNHEETKKEVNV